MHRDGQLLAETRLSFKWHIPRLRSLSIESEWVPVDELTWQLKLPLFESVQGGPMDLVPFSVLYSPDCHPGHYQRMQRADFSYPLDTMRYGDQRPTIIMDGFHRLLKAIRHGRQTIEIRRVPPEKRELIERLGNCAVCEAMERSVWGEPLNTKSPHGWCTTSRFKGRQPEVQDKEYDRFREMKRENPSCVIL